MKNAKTPRNPNGEETGPPGHASFIVRCWVGQEQQLRIRLIDVNSGISHPVADLSSLPGLLLALLKDIGG